MNDDRLHTVVLTDGDRYTFEVVKVQPHGWVWCRPNIEANRTVVFPPHRVQKVVRDNPEALDDA